MDGGHGRPLPNCRGIPRWSRSGSSLTPSGCHCQRAGTEVNVPSAGNTPRIMSATAVASSPPWSLQRPDHPRPPVGRVVLAQLPLALDLVDPDVEPDDLAEQPVHESGRPVQRPRPGHGGLVHGHGFLHDVQQGVPVLDQSDRPVGVDGGVVPGRDRVLGLVPRRGDVSVRASEHGEGGLPGEFLPVRVGPRHVADQGAVRPGVPVEEEWQVGGERHPAHLGDEQPEAVPLDEVVERGGVGLGEVRRDVHRRTLDGGNTTGRQCTAGQSRKATFSLAPIRVNLAVRRRRPCRVGHRPGLAGSHPAVRRMPPGKSNQGAAMGEKRDRTGKQVRPKTAVKGKRYLCARCRKRSPGAGHFPAFLTGIVLGPGRVVLRVPGRHLRPDRLPPGVQPVAEGGGLVRLRGGQVRPLAGVVLQVVQLDPAVGVGLDQLEVPGPDRPVRRRPLPLVELVVRVVPVQGVPRQPAGPPQAAGPGSPRPGGGPAGPATPAASSSVG